LCVCHYSTTTFKPISKKEIYFMYKINI
jgi:hypothetical protein